MKVRDRTLKETQYKGHWVEAPHAACPCRECFHVHNCQHRLGQGYVDRFVCVTNFEHGCPDPKPKPKHLIYLSGRDHQIFVEKIMKTGIFPEHKLYRRCKRCGCTIDLAHADFETIKRGGRS